MSNPVHLAQGAEDEILLLVSDQDISDEWPEWQYDSVTVEPLKIGQFFNIELEM